MTRGYDPVIGIAAGLTQERHMRKMVLAIIAVGFVYMQVPAYAQDVKNNTCEKGCQQHCTGTPNPAKCASLCSRNCRYGTR
jgi:hypothetical protein